MRKPMFACFKAKLLAAIKTSLTAVLCFALIFMAFPASAQQASKNKNRPNILLIYVDDLGYSDVHCYGKDYGVSFIETPNIDALAAQGIKFNQGYAAAPLCSPSRAALLTGKTPARLNFEFVTKYEKDTLGWDHPDWKARFKGMKLLPPPYTLNLPLEEVTLADALKEEGYHTGIVGKWHVAAHSKDKYNSWSTAFGPSKQGFEWSREAFGEFGRANKPENASMKKNDYGVDELTEQAVSFLKKEHTKPFFLFVSHYFVHTPLDSTKKWLIEKYKKKATHGESRELINYAATVETMDHYVGKLLKELDASGMAENTLVIFTSDNGGHPGFAFNRPFRGSKWNLYEGGTRIPMIMRWPSVIAKGTTTDVPVVQTDFLPTFRAIAGAKGQLKNSIDGISFLPVLYGKDLNLNSERLLIWHFPYYHPEMKAYQKAKSKIGKEDGYISQTKPQSSIRQGNFKLMYFYEDDNVELYNLKDDPSEQNDLSSKMPELTLKLRNTLLNQLKSVNSRIPRRQ